MRNRAHCMYQQTTISFQYAGSVIEVFMFFPLLKQRICEWKYLYVHHWISSGFETTNEHGVRLYT